jgi:hypothetical protein
MVRIDSCLMLATIKAEMAAEYRSCEAELGEDSSENER